MTYEHNESHFFDVVGINQIKTHSYLLANKAYDGKSFHADLLLNLTYFDSELKENFINLSLPIDISIDEEIDMDADVEDGNLDNYAYFLRRSLRKVGSTVQLTTVRGVGYRLEDGHV